MKANDEVNPRFFDNSDGLFLMRLFGLLSKSITLIVWVTLMVAVAVFLIKYCF